MIIVFKSGLRAVMIAAAAATIAGCASQMTGGGPGRGPGDPGLAAAQAAATGHYQEAVRQYVRAASQSNRPVERRRYRLEAGLAAAQGGDIQTAQQMLSSINPGALDSTDQARYTLAQREISIANLSPDQALAKLPPPARNTPPVVAQRVWEKRADLHFANHEPVAGIQALAQRDIWLMSDRAIQANDNRIYDKALDAIALGIGANSPAASATSPTTRGWLALANIGQSQFANREQRDRALARWQSRYPGHPANRAILTQRFNYAGATEVSRRSPGQGLPGATGIPTPISEQVALALPMDGRFQNAAKAIRDGFMFAYQNKNGDLPQPVVYNSGPMTPQQLISRAQADNVGTLVGPLDKNKVMAMSRQQALSMPEIALNTVDDANQRPGFYQFGLSPEDEARSAAAHAKRAGYGRALALVPDNDWGHRVLNAFRAAFQARGGRLLEHQTYNSNSHDHSQAIQSLLPRKNAGPNTNGDGDGDEEGDGAPRSDFIFVAAQPVQARLIRSQLKYYDAADLPMVTTSHAFSGTIDAAQDIDLNGVHFVDMPWLLGRGGTITRLRREAADAYGAQATSYARLFAMGMDAWLLARRLNHGGLSDDQPIEGMTGVLSVLPNDHIRRYLGWAVFRSGRPRTLSMPAASDARIGDDLSEPDEPPPGAAPRPGLDDNRDDPWSSGG